jgi:hypothetical protein
MVELEAAISPPPSGTCCTDPDDPSSPWLFRVRYKKGTVLTTDPAGIPIPSLNTTYYIRLERINWGQGSLSVYSDSQFSQHVPGSPICFSMDNTIGPFRFLHQGVITYASHYRTLRAVVDNLHICSGTSCSSCQGRISAAEETGKDIINVYPNPSSGKFSIFVRSINANSKADILIFNFCGQELRQYSSTANGNELITFDLDDQPAGLYFISVTTDQEKYISRLIIE